MRLCVSAVNPWFLVMRILQVPASIQPPPPIVLPNVTPSRRWKRLFIAAACALLLWVAWDLYGPRSHDLRDFQPDEVGRLETAMWRSYYSHANLSLFRELAELLRRQYHLPLLRSYVTAWHAARAATVFQAGHSRADYEKALPPLVSFYSAIARASVQRFDVPRTARLELEWWIAHRERALHPRDELDRTLAALQSELYHLPAGRFAEHARLRADAMLLRDAGAESGTPAPHDWDQIDRMLHDSWRSLWNTVNAPSAAVP